MENQEQWDWIAKLNALINFIMVNVIQVNIIRNILIYLFELKETKIAKFWKKNIRRESMTQWFKTLA